MLGIDGSRWKIYGARNSQIAKCQDAASCYTCDTSGGFVVATEKGGIELLNDKY